ncbi:B2 protein [Vitis vinifera]|uniref:B2 protein n=1 Tax=Vitis vinifera TaxID=29760 RepID=A0A438KCN7_VITVI|nr:B2 protein [Vitis vinifera]
MADKKNKKKAEDAAGASERPSSSEKKTPKSLKPERKIEKRSPSRNIFKAKVATGALQIQGVKGKQNKRSESNGKEGTSKAERHETKKPKSKERNKEKNYENHMRKDQPKKNKDERHELEKNLENQKNKEKLGGLIFMCSAKTKPDCFRYHVMGVSTSKKDLVLGVKPGLKLFLYDFDLKLMHGIYKASSSGGMKLEPEAFDGAFPVQVRFTVHMDCYPLPESIFKKAIKDNYDKTNKFKTELTMEQVKKLMKLFRPTEIHSKALPIHSPPEQEQESVIGKFTEEKENPIHAVNHCLGIPTPLVMLGATPGCLMKDTILLHTERQHLLDQRNFLPRVEEFPPDSFMSEKEYRTYGLQRASRNMTPPAHEREHLLRQEAPIYVDVAHGQEHVGRDPPFVNELEYRTQGLQARRELPLSVLPATANPAAAVVERGHLLKNAASVHGEPLARHTTFINEGEYLTSHLGARRELPSSIPAATVTTASAYPRDPYYSTYSSVPVDTYPPPPRREEVRAGSYFLSGRAEPYLGETDRMRMREADTLERIYSTYASDAPLKYDQIHHYQKARPEPGNVPVSSLYSFAGPSSFRR